MLLPEIKNTILLFLVVSLSVPTGAAVVVDYEGVTVYPEEFKTSSSITVTGGEATFTGTINNGVTVAVSGGLATFTGVIKNNSIFNLSGGSTVIQSLQNNASIFVINNAQLTLVHAVGNNAEVDLQDMGELVLEGDDLFSNNSQLTASGGVIHTQGHDVSFETAELSGSTVIDLGGGTNTVDLGTVTGSGEIVFTNWDPDTEVYFSETSTVDAGKQLRFKDSGNHVKSGVVSPVPEPAATALAIAGLCGFILIRRRSNKTAF
jgi:hypothetical protein